MNKKFGLNVFVTETQIEEILMEGMKKRGIIPEAVDELNISVGRENFWGKEILYDISSLDIRAYSMSEEG
jgi:hypothetical protein